MAFRNIIAVNIFVICHLLYIQNARTYAEILNVKAVVVLHTITTVFRRAKKHGMKIGLESLEF
jgi:hydroxymethylpyrimidine/phosphomethylpyrimidine kinase